MFTLETLLGFPVAVYFLVVTLWNACIALLQVMQSVMREAKQEAAEVMTLLDDGTPMMDAIASTSLLLGPTNSWQMLIIARPSSFVLLLRLSKRRVLHLEVDERFVTSKLEVIQTELMLHVQHVPRLLQMPTDTQLVRYTPMSVPYLWKEERADPDADPDQGQRCGDESEVVDVPSVPSTPVTPTPVSARSWSSRRRKCVQLLAESTVRRRLRMEGVPRRETGVAKARRESVSKRKGLTNATNVRVMHTEGGSTSGMDPALDESESYGWETPKQARTEKQTHRGLSENLSVPNLVSVRKAVVEKEPRRMSSQVVRRKRGQFDLYAKGVQSEFSLLRNV